MYVFLKVLGEKSLSLVFDRILEFYPQFFFFSMFNWTIQCLVECDVGETLKTKTDQDASAWGTESLVLTD